MPVNLRVLLRLAAVLCLLTCPGWAAAQAAGTKVFPSITVTPPGVSGAAAVAALGANLTAVADYYGTTADQLREQLLREPGLRLSRTGRLVRLSPGPSALVPAPAAAFAMASGFAMSSPAAIPLGETFRLHSKPDAQKTIHLNFRGATLTADEHTAISVLDPFLFTVVVPPFSADADPAFSDAELRTIQEIWQRIAEDYAPFDVDVTTEQPAADSLSRADVADQVFGIDVLFTLHDDAWLIGSEAGLSFPGSFFETSPDGDGLKPAFVFYAPASPTAIDPTDARTLADAASREIGTTLGLLPDGQYCAGDPFLGQGSSSVTGWAPIMAALSSRPLRQFDKGEYASPSQGCGDGGLVPQDDFAVITAAGLPLRPDDVGNTPATASWLPVSSSGGRSTGSADGVITSATDVDLFHIDVGAGLLNVSADPAPLGPNADLVVTLRDAAGNALQQSNPAGELASAVNVNISTPGRYYLEVKGGGEGNPLVDGYSSYGSVGGYTLSGNFTTPPNAPPSASIAISRSIGADSVIITFDAAGSGDDGSIMRYSWNFGDGTSLEQVAPAPVQKTYSAAVSGNSYPVTLTVTDNTGLSAAVTRTIIPGAAPPPWPPSPPRHSPGVRRSPSHSIPQAPAVRRGSRPMTGVLADRSRRPPPHPLP